MKRDNSGSLSKNTRKEKDTHPDLKGQAVIGGKEYWISGWKKDGENGAWVSLAFEEKQAKAQPSRSEDRGAHSIKDDLPW